jgi:8-oxo-dGTP pyrophosphatase MutT (NUDIX family)
MLEFFGGKQEPGEVDEATVCREAREEWRLAPDHPIHVERKLAETFYAFPEATCNIALYELIIAGDPEPNPSAEVVAEWFWATLDRIEELKSEFVPSNLPLIVALRTDGSF